MCKCLLHPRFIFDHYNNVCNTSDLKLQPTCIEHFRLYTLVYAFLTMFPEMAVTACPHAHRAPVNAEFKTADWN